MGAFMERINHMKRMQVVKRVVQIEHSDLTIAGTSESVDLGAVWGDGIILLGAYLDITTLFSGGSVSACVAEVGIKSGDVDSMLASIDVFTGASTGIINTYGAVPAGYYGAITPSIKFTSTSDNLVNLTAGDLSVVLAYIDIAKAYTNG